MTLIACRNNAATPHLASTVAIKPFAIFCVRKIAKDRWIAAAAAANASTANAASCQTLRVIKLKKPPQTKQGRGFLIAGIKLRFREGGAVK